MTRIGLILLVAALVCLEAAPSAVADGRMYAVINESATIPDQQALIHYASGVETLVIETRFSGTGKDFAWVVPVPAKPEIIAVSTGLFPTVRAMMKSELIDTYGLEVLAGVAAFVTIALFLISFCRDLVARVFLYAAVILFLGVFCLLPTLGKARGIDGPGIEVQDRQIVGAFETTTLAAASADELDAWLKTNGFATDARAKAAAADYIARGWCFVASRLRVDAQTGKPMTPHPLGFRFKTAQAVYPLKLTGTGSSSLSVDLFVFSDRMAHAPGMSVASCASPKRIEVLDDSSWYRRAVGEYNHTQLAALVAGATTVTKLSGTLSPARMAEDATLTWSAPESIRERVFGTTSAAAVGVLCAVGFVWLLVLGRAVRRFAGVTARGSSGAAPRWRIAMSAAACGLLVFWCLPKVPVRMVHLIGRSSLRLRELGYLLEMQVPEAPKSGPAFTLSVEWARSQMASVAKEAGLEPGPESPREEDSPGNYTLSMNGSVLEYRFYDENGLEHLVPIRAE